MTAFPMSTEILMLGWAIVLVLLQLVLQASSSSMGLSIGYLMGPRDEARSVTNIYAGRISRALHNVLETFPLFAALALALVVTGRGGGAAALGAQIYVGARAIYVPLYVLGIPVVRTIAFVASMAGIVMMLVALLGK